MRRWGVETEGVLTAADQKRLTSSWKRHPRRLLFLAQGLGFLFFCPVQFWVEARSKYVVVSSRPFAVVKEQNARNMCLDKSGTQTLYSHFLARCLVSCVLSCAVLGEVRVLCQSLPSWPFDCCKITMKVP